MRLLLALVCGIVFFAAHAVSVIFRDARVDDPAGLGAITLFAIATVLTLLIVALSVVFLRIQRPAEEAS